MASTPKKEPRGADIAGPVRRCAQSRRHAAKDGLLRLVLDPAGRPYIDVLGRAPGRGVYLAAEREVLKEALSPKGMGRLFRGQAKGLEESQIEAFIIDTLAKLTARLLELLALARRAGQLEIGTDAVLSALNSAKKSLVVVAAADQSSRSRQVIEDAVERIPNKARMWRIGDKAAMGVVLGRMTVGVVAVRESKLASRIADEASRIKTLSQDLAKNELSGSAVRCSN